MPAAATTMPRITVQSETESSTGWVFRIRLEHPGADPTEHTLTLAWADYNYWSPGGAAAPERIAAWVLGFVADRRAPDNPPARFDASTARRWYRDLDFALRADLGG